MDPNREEERMKRNGLLMTLALAAQMACATGTVVGTARTSVTPSGSTASTFEIGKEAFLLNGKPFVIRCGELHYSRIPRAYWRHRLQMVRACGFNVVCAYMFWNNHERVRGQYDFTGQKDVAAFCRLAQEEGLWVVLRPGPYTCSEWDFGGLPWWLLKDDIKIRSTDPRYLKPASDYLAAVGKELRDCQVTRGGNILMAQVENEYGSFGEDASFMRAQYDALRAAGFEVPLFTCNGTDQLRKGYIPEALAVVNLGGNPKRAFDALRAVQTTGPLMCGEYYPAWFDSWGERHSVKDSATILSDLGYMLSNRMSFSMYMAHGGTTFAWWSGANAPFRPQTSSYDFDAPVTEAGWIHPTKFAALRTLFSKYLHDGETIPPPPAALPVQKGSARVLPQIASIRSAAIDPLVSDEPLPFEKADFGYGFAVYSTTLPANVGGEVRADVRDLGVVMVDDEVVGYLDRRYPKETFAIPSAEKARRLEIIVEPLGRYNYGQIMTDSAKGIRGSVKIGDTALKGWRMLRFNLDGDAMDRLVYREAPKKGEALPPGCFYKYAVRMEAKDTFLDMRAWKRGMVRVNGHWIGRYWSIGPTQTMFVPGCWLKAGENEIIVWDCIGLSSVPETLVWRDTPILGEMRRETDYITLRPRPKLTVRLSNPVHVGVFPFSAARQDVRFQKPVTGRVFVFESLNAWNDKPFAACGELDLVDGNGANIPHTKWSIAACDSEERTAEDGSAENIIDGQTSNMWHTEFGASSPDHPHYFAIDLGRTETIGGFNFTPRQSKGDGFVRDYKVYVLSQP